MKLTILQNKLKLSIELVSRLAGKSFSLPILTNVLLETEKNFLSLTTTDLELAIKCWILAKIEEQGAITVPAPILANTIQLLPDKNLRLLTDNHRLIIETQSYRTEIQGLSSDDFPVIPEESSGICIKLPAFDFCQALEQISDIAVTSTARPEMAGIYFLFQKDLIKMAATDSFRLGEKTLFLQQPLDIKENYSLILPQRAAREIINIFGEREVGKAEARTPERKAIKVFLGPNQILLESLMPEIDHPQFRLVSRLIEGEYPNYQEIIPKKYETQIVLDRQEFLKQIKLASLFSGKVNEVKIKVVPKKEIIEILSQSPEIGQHYSLLPCRIKGEGQEISFNYKFLIDGLLKMKSSEVIFELTKRNDEIGPGVLKPVGDPSYIYVLMPVQSI